MITARGGSKGVPYKNIREIAGLPLIAYKIRAAQRCGFLGRIIVSTDDSEIAEIAREYGAEVPNKLKSAIINYKITLYNPSIKTINKPNVQNLYA